MSTDKDPSMEAIRLQVAYAKRNALFARMQKIFDLSKNVGTTERTSEPFLNASISMADIRSEFRTVLDEYNILKIRSDPDATPSYDALTSFEDMYCSCKRILDRLSVKQKPSTFSADELRPEVTKPRLPPLQIMSFDGDVKNWPMFYANFKSLIHDNTSLTDEERVYYLMSRLSQAALNVISGITPDGQNYSLILKTLIERYEDKRLLASTYIEQILNFKLNGVASHSNFQSFMDKVATAVGALKNLNLNDLADYLLLHMTLKKLDTDTVKGFELQVRDSAIPTFSQLVDFVRTQIRVYQACNVSSKTTTNSGSKSNRSTNNQRMPNPQSYVSNEQHDIKCLCNNITHDFLYKCPLFQKMTPANRFTHIKVNNACLNCLSINHKTGVCKANQKCTMCKQKHHTLLHFNKIKGRVSTPNSDTGQSVRSSSQMLSFSNTKPEISQSTFENGAGRTEGDATLCATCNTNAKQSTLSRRSDVTTTVALATVQVVVNNQLVRCLLDSASQSNFITSDCCVKLGLKHYENSKVVVTGVGCSNKPTLGKVNLTFHSRFNLNISFDMSALIVDRITSELPSVPIDETALPHLRSLPLADEMFATPGPIEALIGASLFPHLLLPGMIINTQCNKIPPVIKTVLGFVVVGSLPTLQSKQNVPDLVSCCSVVTRDPLDVAVKRFWELEEISIPPVHDPNDLECEEHFSVTTTRDSSGRYEVALPFRLDAYLLGDSRKVAEKRFICLERKLESYAPLREAYDNVIRDYIENGYLSPVTIDSNDNTPSYVIPHHGVYRPDKSTKLRPVLDASCTTSTGYSLNDVLHSGPNLQGDLFCILLNFRLFSVAFCADVKQMFLQIGMRPEDRRFQRILYRFSPHNPMQLFEFTRVCFGFKSSPYHALRVVKQLASDEGERYPKAAKILSTSLFMDDIAYSLPDEFSAVETVTELIQLFKCGQFDLMKWTSNSKRVLESIPASHKMSSEVEFDKQTQHKILGLRWSMSDDCFVFQIVAPDTKCTKRVILSTVARFWDILGFVAPTILYAKLLIKELWLIKCDWDDCPPSHIEKLWHNFCAELPCLNGLKIPRHVGVSAGVVVNVLGFADASERAYGAVVYLHITRADHVSTELVCAKSKLSPTKTLTVARLELCAVELLSRLLRRVCDTYSPRYDISGVYGFTDSKVVLCWLNSSPHRWQTFVANRVVKITENFPPTIFFHVAGSENPADCLSRGLTPKKLLTHQLWFKGPSWLSSKPSDWPINKINDISIEEPLPEEKLKAFPIATSSREENVIYLLCLRISHWNQLLRTVVFVLRFAKKLPRRHSLIASSEDLKHAECMIMSILQSKYFPEDIDNIKNGKNCSRSLIKLKPFLDNDGLIRVGGRLSNSSVDYDQRYPIILPRRDHIVDLIIDHYHVKYFHAGPVLLMSLLRQSYWILASRSLIRHRILKCNSCFRAKPRPNFPTMADLPNYRVNQVEKAFTHVGCDYAGPLQYTPYRGRGVKSRKAWLCIFTCMTVRAIHIEMVTDLSTVSFLSAFKRFLSRRGPVKCLYTDRGTNFLGANSYLRDLYKFLEDFHQPLLSELSKERVDWKFIPPASPHFGGCWESMVKIVKTHLFKSIGSQILSYEEMLTTLTQIEALINSRPLTALSSDPSEPSALTPAHFLCSGPLTSMPITEATTYTLQERRSLLNSLVQSFWQRWRLEYLHQLQSRAKWNIPSVPIMKGTVVVVIVDNAPPYTWPLGVIEEAYISKDGITRVATVRTSKGNFVRPVVKLCPLPTQ